MPGQPLGVPPTRSPLSYVADRLPGLEGVVPASPEALAELREFRLQVQRLADALERDPFRRAARGFFRFVDFATLPVRRIRAALVRRRIAREKAEADRKLQEMLSEEAKDWARLKGGGDGSQETF